MMSSMTSHLGSLDGRVCGQTSGSLVTSELKVRRLFNDLEKCISAESVK